MYRGTGTQLYIIRLRKQKALKVSQFEALCCVPCFVFPCLFVPPFYTPLTHQMSSNFLSAVSYPSATPISPVLGSPCYLSLSWQTVKLSVCRLSFIFTNFLPITMLIRQPSTLQAWFCFCKQTTHTACQSHSVTTNCEYHRSPTTDGNTNTYISIANYW